MRKGAIALVAAALSLAVLAGCGGANPPANQGDQGQTKQPAGQKQEQPAGQAEAKQWSAPPAMEIDPEKQYIATMETSLGNLKIELFAKDAPKTVNNFVFLARQGYYEGVVFHRIIKDFMIQGGDPTGTGGGGPGYTIPDELPPKLPYTRGIVAMARTNAPNSAGSQFFICTGANCGGLDQAPNYAQFGKVIEGDDVLTKLESVEVVKGNPVDRLPSKPTDPPVITKITIEEK